MWLYLLMQRNINFIAVHVHPQVPVHNARVLHKQTANNQSNTYSWAGNTLKLQNSVQDK